jgi:hypothetical protein
MIPVWRKARLTATGLAAAGGLGAGAPAVPGPWEMRNAGAAARRPDPTITELTELKSGPADDVPQGGHL